MRQIALFSAYDKTGIASLARSLVGQGLEIVATGKTRSQLEEEGLKVTDISELTDEPERFGGRIKTLHHKVFGGILFRPGQDEKEWPYGFRVAAVVCNFYPFVEKSAACKDLSELMEWVDIGGPSMVRAAAKNHAHVWVFTHPSQYTRFTACPQEDWPRLRERFAMDAFERVSELDEAVADTFLGRYDAAMNAPALRYGENPHQKASFTPNRRASPRFTGEFSYNNIRDAEAALRFVLQFEGPAVSVVKHQTLCGAAAGLKTADSSRVFELAWEGDPVSRFGGVLAFNFIPKPAVTEILAKKFIEVVVLPQSAEANAWAKDFHKQKEKVRIVQVDFANLAAQARSGVNHREIFQGVLGKLVQEPDRIELPETASKADKLFSAFGQWAAACSKSNAMVLAGFEEGSEVAFLAGTGQGQPNRVEALRLLALPRAQEFCKRRNVTFSSLTCFSDGFIPFTDTVTILNEAGIKRLVQPGGSKADAEVSEMAQRLGVKMEITGRRHFWH